MTLPFWQYLDVLQTHGRAAAHSLGQLSPSDAVPPRGEVVREVAESHWAILEIWARSVENPAVHWSRGAQPVTPAHYPTLIAGISDELDRVAGLLAAAGPDVDIDYFARRGTTAEVARLLAHEAITVAFSLGLAAGGRTMPVLPAVASDGIDHTLSHWGTAEADGVWDPNPLAVRTTDTGDAWQLLLGRERSDSEDEFCLVADGVPAAVVEASANNALWWLHGHVQSEGDVAVSGDAETIRRLRSALMHPDQ